jgi:hypothetical protein
MKRETTVVVAAVPGLVLAGFGLIHPAFLDETTAMRWWQLHIPLIPMFPLLAGAMWLVLRGVRGGLPGGVAWLARIAAYLFACLYTALDTISGISAGLVTERLGGSQAVLDLFAVGDELGHIGVWCLVASTVLAAVALFPRDGLRVVPGTVVLLVSAWAFYRFHIFSPYGALSMLGYAVGFALLAAAKRPAATPLREAVPAA